MAADRPGGTTTTPPAGFATPRRSLAKQLRRTKLDLLPVLHELLLTRSVSVTARTLGITQPAVSRGLKQLREMFEDDLLTGLGHGAELTERAKELVPELDELMSRLAGFVEPAHKFDPQAETLIVIIHTSDYGSRLLAPRLMSLCASEAPHVVFRFVVDSFQNIDDLAQIDLMIGTPKFGHRLGKRFEYRRLWTDEMVCLAPRSALRSGGTITAEEFKSARHVAFQPWANAPAGMTGPMVSTASLEVAPICTVANFFAIGALVEQSGALAIIPRKLAEECVATRDVGILELDYPDTRFEMGVLWSPAAGSRRGHDWLLTTLTRAASGV
jgi:DNA-binding transcriptional LysR family regulator